MSVSNPVPNRLARVVEADVPALQELGRPGAERVFLTAAEDVKGLSAKELSKRLGIDPADSFYVIEFPTQNLRGSLASPIFHLAQCFIGGGRTRGGAREFTAWSQTIPQECSNPAGHMKIDSETTAIGGRGGDAQRARQLARALPRLAITDGGWSALHFDPDDGRFWEYTYPESELHGGGPPLLHVLSEEEARAKYGDSTMADPRLSEA